MKNFQGGATKSTVLSKGCYMWRHVSLGFRPFLGLGCWRVEGFVNCVWYLRGAVSVI